MNYYSPNFYQNYAGMQLQGLQNPVQQQTMPQPPQYLNGKIVDSIEMVKATEVPIGGYGFFPKADLSEIYSKNWNPNGTTSITTFKPVIEEPIKDNQNNTMSELLEKIAGLERKIDGLLDSKTAVRPKYLVKENGNED